MLTLVTQAAISVLIDISGEGYSARTELPYTKYPHMPELLAQLESGGLIQLRPDCDRNSVLSYRLARSFTEISLLDILRATGEHINCNQPLGEKYYYRYGRTAHKLGILNSIMLNLLSDIRLDDL